jgi:hypothetical protein
MLKGKYVATITINFNFPDDNDTERPETLLPNKLIKEQFENELADAIKQEIEGIMDEQFMQTNVEMEYMDYYEE